MSRPLEEIKKSGRCPKCGDRFESHSLLLNGYSSYVDHAYCSACRGYIAYCYACGSVVLPKYLDTCCPRCGDGAEGVGFDGVGLRL